MRFAFVRAEKANHAVEILCRVLEVSRSGFYAWSQREESARAKSARVALVHIRAVYRQHSRRYGSPRIFDQLRDEGFAIGRHRVARLMRSARLVARGKRKFKTTTDSNHKLGFAPNLVDRKFQVAAPNRVWLADITYVHTREGWLFLHAVLDAFSRRIVGWILDETMDAVVTTRALRQAIAARRPVVGLIHHSDRGVQYASHEYRRVLAHHGIRQSMSRKGNCWDNAPMESFFATLKRELFERPGWGSRAEASHAIADYIAYYNRDRKHSTLAYVSPQAYELKNAA